MCMQILHSNLFTNCSKHVTAHIKLHETPPWCWTCFRHRCTSIYISQQHTNLKCGLPSLTWVFTCIMPAAGVRLFRAMQSQLELQRQDMQLQLAERGLAASTSKWPHKTANRVASVQCHSLTDATHSEFLKCSCLCNSWQLSPKATRHAAFRQEHSQESSSNLRIASWLCIEVLIVNDSGSTYCQTHQHTDGYYAGSPMKGKHNTNDRKTLQTLPCLLQFANKVQQICITAI